MAVPQHKIDWPSHEVAPRGPVTAGQMPARALQDLLSERNMMFAEPHVDRWSQRRALAFITVSAFSLWAALLFAAHAAVKVVI